MSEQTKKMNDKKKTTKGEEEAPQAGGFLGYVIGGLLGLGVLIGLWALNQGQAQVERKELPQLVVMVEFDDLSSTETRKAIADLHRALLETGEAVFGPSNYPILLPARTAEELPVPHNLEDLTPEQFKRAAGFFQVSGWFVPRLYAPDLKSCVFRVFPNKTPRFRPQVKKKVQEVLDRFKGTFNKVWRYSYDLGLTDQEHRGAINIAFGVQTANVAAITDDNGFKDLGRLERLSLAVRGYKNQRVRSMATMADFYHYLMAVYTNTPQAYLNFSGLAQKQTELDALLAKCRMPEIVRSDGSTAVVLVTTDAERQDNLELCYNIAANLQVEKTKFHPNR